MIKQDVLNAGYVRLVEYMGGDKSVIRNARRCWRSEDKSSERSDRNLIRPDGRFAVRRVRNVRNRCCDGN
jgi:hypothetical protein